jgi:hypothetical protein
MPGSSRPGKMTRMATAVCGNTKRAAPGQFRGHSKTRGLTGQSPLPKTALLTITSHRILALPLLSALSALSALPPILLLRRWSWLGFAATPSSRFPTATARLVSATSTARMINRLIMLGGTTAFVAACTAAAFWFAYNFRRRGRMGMWSCRGTVWRWRSLMRRRSSRMMRGWRRHMFYSLWCGCWSRYMRRWSSAASSPSRLWRRRTRQQSTRCNGTSWSPRCAGWLRAR